MYVRTITIVMIGTDNVLVQSHYEHGSLIRTMVNVFLENSCTCSRNSLINCRMSKNINRTWKIQAKSLVKTQPSSRPRCKAKKAKPPGKTQPPPLRRVQKLSTRATSPVKMPPSTALNPTSTQSSIFNLGAYFELRLPFKSDTQQKWCFQRVTAAFE